MKTLTVFLFICLFPGPVHAAVTYNNVFTAVNSERISHGVPSLNHNETLDRVAEERLAYLIKTGVLSHEAPKKYFTLMKEGGYDYKYAGENLAMKYLNVQNVVSGWMNSKSHRENLLNPKYTETGIATNGNYVVQEFGMTKSEFIYRRTSQK